MKISIEFAHIYGNQQPNSEQEESVQLALDLVENLKQQHEISSVVMIDDYNANMESEFPSNYVSWLKHQGLSPDFVTFESFCIPHAQKLVETFNSIKPGGLEDGVYQKETKTYLYLPNQRKIKLVEDGHYQCSLLASILDSAKLGAFPLRGFEVNSGNIELETIITPSDLSLVILPSFYEQVEQNAMKILSASSYANYVDKIHHFYFGSHTKSVNEFLEEIL